MSVRLSSNVGVAYQNMPQTLAGSTFAKAMHELLRECRTNHYAEPFGNWVVRQPEVIHGAFGYHEGSDRFALLPYTQKLLLAMRYNIEVVCHDPSSLSFSAPSPVSTEASDADKLKFDRELAKYNVLVDTINSFDEFTRRGHGCHVTSQFMRLLSAYQGL